MKLRVGVERLEWRTGSIMKIVYHPLRPCDHFRGSLVESILPGGLSVFSKSLIFFFKSRDKRKMAQLAKAFAGKSDNLVIPQNPNGGPLISTHVPWH